MRIKNIVLAIVLVCTSNLIFAQKANKIQKATIQISIKCDHCKMCETCGKMFEEKLYDVKGLKRFELNESSKTLTVYYNTQKTNLDAIRTTISNLGYDADGVKAVPEAYTKLDGCCKN